MALSIQKNRIWLAVAAVLLIIIGWERCNREIDISDDLRALQTYKDTVIHEKTKNGTLISRNKALKLSESSYKAVLSELKGKSKKLKDQLSALRKIASATIIKTDTRIDTVEALFTDTIPCVFERTISVDSAHYYLEANITQKKFRLNTFRIINEQNIVIGDRKPGLFKKSEHVVTVTNSNPYINVNGIQSYTIEPESFPFSIGPSIQYGLDLKSMKPSFNMGVSFQWQIKFK